MPFPCLAIADNVVYDLDIRTALGSTARIPGPVPIVGAFLHEFYGIDMPYVPIMGRGAAQQRASTAMWTPPRSMATFRPPRMGRAGQQARFWNWATAPAPGIAPRAMHRT
jgi:hypothetical protein